MLRSTLAKGSKFNCWKTKPISFLRKRGEPNACGELVEIVPEDGLISEAINLNKVLFPQPENPLIRVIPGEIFRSKSVKIEILEEG